MNDDGNAAVFTGTFFESGLSVMVCGDCFVSFAAGTLEAMTGVPVGMLLEMPAEGWQPEGSETPTVEAGEAGPIPDESSEAGTVDGHDGHRPVTDSDVDAIVSAAHADTVETPNTAPAK